MRVDVATVLNDRLEYAIRANVVTSYEVLDYVSFLCNAIRVLFFNVSRHIHERSNVRTIHAEAMRLKKVQDEAILFMKCFRFPERLKCEI